MWGRARCKTIIENQDSAAAALTLLFIFGSFLRIDSTKEQIRQNKYYNKAISKHLALSKVSIDLVIELLYVTPWPLYSSRKLTPK